MSGYAAKWPFVFVVDSRSASIGWAVVNARIVTRERQDQLAELRRAGFRFVGMSSDTTFPLGDRADPLDYGALCEAWCHCFRDPARYLPPGLPRALLSASDFTDYCRVAPEAVLSAAPPAPPFDFVCVSATQAWKQEAKNWELARRCLPRITRELGLRALVIGAPADGAEWPGVRFLPHLPWLEFLTHLARARFLFVPNERDASPRVIAEALCLDVPVVMNRQILGGWKYLNVFTGTFFESEGDVVPAVRRCLQAPTSPRRWFRANHGPYLAGRRLLALLRSVDPTITERSHLALAEQIDQPAALAP